MHDKDESINTLIQIVDALHGKLKTPPRPKVFPTWKIAASERPLKPQPGSHE